MNLKTKILFFLIFFCTAVFSEEQTEPVRIKIYGTIIDARTNKPIPKFSFNILPYQREIRSDQNGQFLLNIPMGNIQLIFNDYPFDKQEININLQNDTSFTVTLTSRFENRYIEEVEIIASKPVNEKIASIDKLDKQFFLTSPSLLGERDLIKILSLTAGVTSSNEACADMQVRGGNHGQNLYLLNTIPLYFTQHALGLTSAYNPTIVQSAELYKAGFPAYYGGKISSVIHVNTIEPSLNKKSGELEIGLLSSKAFLNFPLKKNKLGMYISGRISNFSPFLTLANSFTEKNDTHLGILFADVNIGTKYKINEKNSLFVDFFYVGDHWNVKQKDQNDLTKFLKKNSQINLSLNWKCVLSSLVKNNFTAYIDNYTSSQNNQSETNLYDETKKIYTQEYGTAITSINISDNVNWKVNSNVNIYTGVLYKDNILNPLFFNVSDSITNKSTKKTVHLHEFDFFIHSEICLSEIQKLSIGLRTSTMVGKDLFFSFEPRLTYQIQLSKNYSLSLSLSKMTQPIHRVANSGLGFPTEVYVSSTASLLPEESWIYSLGGGKEINKANYRITIKADLWYKQMENIVEFYDGMDAYNMVLNGYNVYDENQQVITSGKGKAYGMDFSLSYNRKKTTVNADYTLMHAVDQFEELNNGKPFNSPTDIRNSLSLTVSQKLSQTLLFTANWQFNSGKSITVPKYVIPKPDADFTNNATSSSNSHFIFLYTERNNYRTRPFHKLDVSLTKNFLMKKKYQGSFTFGLYNVYNQANPFLYTLSVKKINENAFKPVLKSVSIFPIIPSFSFRVKF